MKIKASQIQLNQDCFIVTGYSVTKLTRKADRGEDDFLTFHTVKDKRVLLSRNETVFYSELDALYQLEDDLDFELRYTRNKIKELEKNQYYPI